MVSSTNSQKIILREEVGVGRKLGFRLNVVDAVTDQTGLHRKQAVEGFASGGLRIHHRGQVCTVCGSPHRKSQYLGQGDGEVRSHPLSYTTNSRSPGNLASGQQGSPKRDGLSPVSYSLESSSMQ